MPTYDYACQACDHQFEHFQSIKDASLEKCPKCGKKKLKRLLGAGAGLIFKGTGFYITDYKKKSGGGGESKSGGEAKSSGEGKSSSSSGSSAKS
jgi:putative FmdB family regulatory protein